MHSRPKTSLVAAVLAATLLACGPPSAPAPKPASNPCPAGQSFDAEFERCVYERAPSGGAVDTTADCHPITCQVYSDWARFGDGGAGAGWCSGACGAHCAGDAPGELYSLEQARIAGMTCSY